LEGPLRLLLNQRQHNQLLANATVQPDRLQDKARKAVACRIPCLGVDVEYGKQRIRLDDVSGDEQYRSNKSELDGVKPVAIVLDCGKACLLFELAGSANRCIRIIVFMV
jgi:hypothetical protein